MVTLPNHGPTVAANMEWDRSELLSESSVWVTIHIAAPGRKNPNLKKPTLRFTRKIPAGTDAASRCIHPITLLSAYRRVLSRICLAKRAVRHLKVWQLVGEKPGTVFTSVQMNAWLKYTLPVIQVQLVPFIDGP